MSGYETGRFYRATVRGEADIIVFRGRGEWVSPDASSGCYGHNDDHVTNVRPLAVLDPEDDRVQAFLEMCNWLVVNKETQNLHRLIREQLAPPKPPRIAEPGWGAIVKATLTDIDSLSLWQRHWMGPRSAWVSQKHGAACQWDDLIDPVLIRDAMEDS